MGEPDKLRRDEFFDSVLVQGQMHRFERQFVRSARRIGVHVLMSGELADLGEHNAAKALARDRYLKLFYAHVAAFCIVGAEARRHLLSKRVSQ